MITAKRVFTELVSETVVSYFKAFAYVQILREAGPIWATAVLAFVWIGQGMTFTVNVGTIADPIYQLYFFIVSLIQNGRAKKENSWDRILLDLARIGLAIGAAVAGGATSNWLVGAPLNSALEFQNIYSNVAASFVVMTLIAMIAQHAVILPLTSNADGYTSMIGIGTVSGGASLLIFLITQGALDSAVVIAQAAALRNAGNGWLWATLGALGLGAGLTMVLYFLLWEDVFSPSAQMAKRGLQVEAALQSKPLADSSDEDQVPLAASNKKHRHHADAMVGY